MFKLNNTILPQIFCRIYGTKGDVIMNYFYYAVSTISIVIGIIWAYEVYVEKKKLDDEGYSVY